MKPYTPKLYTPKEAAKILRVSYPTFYNFIRRRQIPLIILSKGKNRRLIRIAESDLMDFIQSRKEKMEQKMKK